jgi:hypothetical protein
MGNYPNVFKPNTQDNDQPNEGGILGVSMIATAESLFNGFLRDGGKGYDLNITKLKKEGDIYTLFLNSLKEKDKDISEYDVVIGSISMSDSTIIKNTIFSIDKDNNSLSFKIDQNNADSAEFEKKVTSESDQDLNAFVSVSPCIEATYQSESFDNSKAILTFIIKSNLNDDLMNSLVNNSINLCITKNGQELFCGTNVKFNPTNYEIYIHVKNIYNNKQRPQEVRQFIRNTNKGESVYITIPSKISTVPTETTDKITEMISEKLINNELKNQAKGIIEDVIYRAKKYTLYFVVSFFLLIVFGNVLSAHIVRNTVSDRIPLQRSNEILNQKKKK